MRIVVTGATSFIGNAVVEELLGGCHQVFACVRPDSVGRASLEAKRGKWLGQLTVLPVDLSACGTLDRHPALEGRADLWLHLGWEGSGSANRTNPEIQARNIGYALEALGAAARLGCTRFLFSGSQAEYGITDGLMREDSPCHPVSEYGKDKLEVCRRAGEKAGELGITYLHTRIFSVYGPGDHPWSLVSSCVDTFLKGGHMEFGACTQLWNYLYIKDAVRAITGLLLAKSPSGVYNVAGNDTRPLREFIGEIHRLCGGRGTFEYGKRPPNAEGVVSLNPDTGKLYRAANFQPRISFEEGIREMIANHEFYKENSK
ncbi:NAD-dependent epimerase/dehydratase family protein [Enterocloster lavalensis]|uniref:NAD-dependent epimerase/dehydratase family protein n=1 Tax=Enterocloster lavalensis TaxID=460384 RepID=UPI001D08F4EC|nr:NAD(P)-dependent oxidoreductase [Enterocloster lavalensis]MCB6346226.1 NAD(P)-dependent oxidoreductase [Enterocloster lavalensis]